MEDWEGVWGTGSKPLQWAQHLPEQLAAFGGFCLSPGLALGSFTFKAQAANATRPPTFPSVLPFVHKTLSSQPLQNNFFLPTFDTSLTSTTCTGEYRGIISSAIANAGKVPSPPGQENVSLLQQHSSSGKPSPTATQFTFTCDSPVPKARWPGTDPYPGSLPTYTTGSKLRQIQMTTPAFAEPGGVGAGSAAVAPAGNGGTQPGTSKKKTRRRAEKDLAMAAKQRRLETQYNNYHNPPKPEDMWICEFCEYEQIFGEPPRALIRQYEIRDQKARHKEEERKRLLEKAKAKSRKGKKPAKSPAKTSSPQNQQPNTGEVPLPLPIAAGDAAHEDYEYTHDDYSNDPEDEFDDSYSQEDPPMLLSDDPDQEEPECTDPDCLNCRGQLKEEDDPGDPKP